MSAVLTEFADGVAVIAIIRPEARNAVNGDVAEGIAAAVTELESRDDLTAGILTGAGGTFCSGMDLKAFTRGDKPNIGRKAFGGLTEAPPSKPLITAVEGWALAGDPISAERAHQFGMVNRLTEPGEALAGARELAAVSAANGPLAVRAAKQVVAMAIDYTDPEQFTGQWHHLGAVFASSDAQEGAKAFAEKRKPNWTGK